MNHQEENRIHGLFGWACFDKQAPKNANDSFSAMRKALNSSIPISHFEEPSHSIGSTNSVFPLNTGGYTAIVGTPIWQTSELHTLSKNTSDAAALANAYKQKGLDCIDLIGGSFAIAVSDPANKLIFLANDRLGLQPLYYKNNSSLIFGSSASTVLAYPEGEKGLTPQSVYNYVYFHMVPSPKSIYESVNKLQAGQRLTIKNGNLSIDKYWKPIFKEKTTHKFESLKKELKDTLTLSVKQSISDENSVGTFLSGGLDSSTVTGVLSELTAGEAPAFSIGFSAKGYDEMAFARNTASHFGVKLHEYYVTPDDVVNALPTIATSYDEPFGNSSALPAWFCAKLAAKHGIKQLLAGDGGDELFAGNERYARQQLFQRYETLPNFARKNLLEPISQKIERKTGVLHKVKRYIEQANVPLPDRLQSYNYLNLHQPSEIFSHDFLDQINIETPLNIQRDIYNTPTDTNALNRMLYLDWQFTLADNDIRKVSHMCALAGVDVAYPLLHDKLLAFSCTIPSKLKLQGNNLRAFYKKALTNWLPDETINKKKQGFGLPFGVWMKSHKPLQELAYDNLLALKERAYFEPTFMDRLISLHRDKHSHYYGELVWVLVVLELWLKQHDRE